MGKATRWFRSLFLSSRKSPGSSPATDKRKSKWVPSNSDQYSSTKLKNHAEDPLASPYSEGLDANKHAIAVAAATAVVAEAALAAAQAAAEVVRLTSGGGSGRNTSYASGDRRIVLAAVKIQSAFRAYLAKRALRALKGLVKLQALVRGHIVRKQSADMLRRMQAMARIQARASKHRAYTSEYPNPKMNCMPNLRKYDERSNIANYGGSLLKQTHPRSRFGNNIVNNESSQMATRWLNHWMEQYNWNNDNGQAGEDDKILEIDTWKPRQSSTTRKETNIPTSQYFSAWKEQEHSRLSSKLLKPNPSISSEDVPSLISPKHPPEGDQIAARTAESSPRVHSASSRPTSNQRGPFTPARSECSRSLFGDYMSHPSYMANTESSRAKLRSHSAPKQRMQLEELSLSGKFGKNIWDSDAVSEKDFALPANNHRSNSYLYSGHGKRQGTPTRDAPSGFGSMYGRRV